MSPFPDAQPRPPRPLDPDEVPAPTLESARIPPPVDDIRVESVGLPEADRSKAEALARRLSTRGVLEASDVEAAEELYARHPGEAPVKNLLGAVLLSAASGERARRRYPEATRYLQRASLLQPESTGPLMVLLQVMMESGDWAGAEAAARGALALDPRNSDALQGLGYALLRQDRNTEAADALRAALEIRQDPVTQALLDRVRKGMADEKGMTQKQLSHFNVRYDGDAHEDVGREILRALERHYATLAVALDHQPSTSIPVILFSREAYYDASGAPAWSGGVYDGIDGRIRIPIAGLTSGLTADMDDTLLHELTHAFVADRTRGVAPRDIQEGLAQYMEGKRLASQLDSEGLAALAEGRIPGVMGFYLGALSFVEYLFANRGMGGMNDLLRAMGETGSVDEAFRRVHGQSYRAVQQAWLTRLRQQNVN